VTGDATTDLVRRIAWWTVVLAGIWAAIALALSGWPMALGVAAGALVGLANVWLIASTMTTLMRNANELRAPGRKRWAQQWTILGPLVMKWPLILLALFGVLWYLPARPEGVALGVAISLAAASIAAIQQRKPSGPAPS
jgi:hypothetical protein